MRTESGDDNSANLVLCRIICRYNYITTNYFIINYGKDIYIYMKINL